MSVKIKIGKFKAKFYSSNETKKKKVSPNKEKSKPK
jgi:hypothetical protein